MEPSTPSSGSTSSAAAAAELFSAAPAEAHRAIRLLYDAMTNLPEPFVAEEAGVYSDDDGSASSSSSSSSSCRSDDIGDDGDDHGSDEDDAAMAAAGLEVGPSNQSRAAGGRSDDGSDDDDDAAIAAAGRTVTQANGPGTSSTSLHAEGAALICNDDWGRRVAPEIAGTTSGKLGVGDVVGGDGNNEVGCGVHIGSKGGVAGGAGGAGGAASSVFGARDVDVNNEMVEVMLIPCCHWRLCMRVDLEASVNRRQGQKCAWQACHECGSAVYDVLCV